MILLDKTRKILKEIDEKFPNYRSNKRWNCDTYAYDSFEDFSENVESLNGVHTIYDGSLPLDLHLTVEKGSPLIVFMNARSSERNESYRLPSFVGFGVAPEQGVSVLRINDPVLYTSRTLRIGWYAGVNDNPLIPLITDAVRKIVEMVEPSKIIFIGGSSGGFASLNFSRFFPGSLAVVWNPQTDLLKFTEEEVLEYASSAYGIDSFDECKRRLPEITVSDLSKEYEGGKASNYVLFMQNIDDWHTREHCIPFFEKIGHNIGTSISTKRINNKIFLYAGNWGRGHAAPPQSFVKSLLSEICSDFVSFESLFEEQCINIFLKNAETAQ